MKRSEGKHLIRLNRPFGQFGHVAYLHAMMPKSFTSLFRGKSVFTAGKIGKLVVVTLS